MDRFVIFTGEYDTTKEAVEEAVEQGADLCDANLGGADLGGANLGGADLVGAYLRGANLGGAYLYDADLRGANLRGANLGGANLRGAYLYGADLRGANLRGANLRDEIKLLSGDSIFRISDIGSRMGTTFAYNTDKGIYVKCGCFFGTLDEFDAKVEQTHGDNKHGKVYKAVIEVIKLRFTE